jgi:HD superfamily phosphohydrolase
LPKAFLIRDPVHGYVQVAAHERILVDNPVTQRLRRINQTGLADLVYPEARTSRFAHSLGAMHLASRFLISCIENADLSDAQLFFGQLEKLDLFKNYSVQPAEIDELLFAERLEGGGLKAAGVVFRHEQLRKNGEHFRRLLGLAEAGLRLAALFHDLGHLPFSHDMEFALQEFVSAQRQASKPITAGLASLVSGDPPHEVIGHRLANLVFEALVDSGTKPAKRAAFAMARKILEVQRGLYDLPKPNAGAIEWLHSLVDGEVDVDRADYLLRDARALGFEFAVYDLERLINNLVLVHHESLGLTTAIEERGFSALETFYVSRSRSNQYLVRHHKVAQIAAAFRYLAEHTLGTADCRDFLDLLNRLGSDDDNRTGPESKELLSSFGNHDDTWWLQILRTAKPQSQPLFEACRGLVLNRQPALISVWKRKGDVSAAQTASMNEALAKNLKNLPALRQEFRSKDMLLLTHKFDPIHLRPVGTESGESLMLLKTGKNVLMPATRHSPLLRSLLDAWNEDIHFNVFRLPTTHMSADDATDMILKGLNAVP